MKKIVLYCLASFITGILLIASLGGIGPQRQVYCVTILDSEEGRNIIVEKYRQGWHLVNSFEEIYQPQGNIYYAYSKITLVFER